MTAPRGQAFGTQPPPRVLYVFDPDAYDRTAIEAIASDLSEAVPTGLVCDHAELQRVRQATFSLAVIFGDAHAFQLHSKLHTVQFGGINTTIGLVTKVSDHSDFTITRWLARYNTSFATLWHVPVELDETYKQLVVRDLIPLVPRGNLRPEGHSGETPVLSLSGDGRWQQGDHMQPLMVDADGEIFALRTVGSAPWRWVLPEEANPQAWIQLVLRDLNATDSVAFPALTRWSDDGRYLTATECSIKAELARVAATRAQVEQDLQEREHNALREQAVARDAAERGPRMLVHAQGDNLVSAVISVLTSLGFEVTRSDDAAAKGDKLEDLQVRPSPGSKEVGLIEVRAYMGGAQLNDLLRIGRFIERYIGATGTVPHRRWYIANQFIQRGPAERSRPLASNPAEVATFGEAGGLVIATHDLLELYLRVERGEMAADDAKALLWRSTGYFALD